MQLNSLDQLVKQHRSAKHALTKKQRQIKKNGEELTSADTRNLTLANKKVTDTQLQIDEVGDPFNLFIKTSLICQRITAFYWD